MKKENEKIDKYLNLARELEKKMRNIKVTVIPIKIVALGTVPKGLERRQVVLEIRGRIETTQTSSSRIPMVIKYRPEERKEPRRLE